MKFFAFYNRWKIIILRYKTFYQELNRRAEVESELLQCWAGKRPLPDQEQCLKWAKKLGIPDEYRD